MTPIGNPIVLIGGAPRSGTSMLMRSLDWHPDVVVLPKEADFVRACAQGLLSTLPAARDMEFASRDALERLLACIASEYVDAGRAVGQLEPERFAQVFASIWQGKTDASPFRRCALALGEALRQASPSLRERYARNERVCFAFKKPFYAELLCARLFDDDPHVYLLWIGRGVFDRYASAKARRLAISADRLVHPTVPGIDYSTFQAALSVASRTIAMQLAARHPERVMMIEYEDIADNPASYAHQVSTFLGIRDDPVLLRSTFLGGDLSQPSSFSVVNSMIGRGDGDRDVGRAAVVNSEERAYVETFAGVGLGTLQSDATTLEDLRRLARAPFLAESEANRATRVRYVDCLESRVPRADVLALEFSTRVQEGHVALL